MLAEDTEASYYLEVRGCYLQMEAWCIQIAQRHILERAILEKKSENPATSPCRNFH